MDKYEAYEKYADFEQEVLGRQPGIRRDRAKPRARAAVLAELTNLSDDSDAFLPSYAAALDPLHHERQWVIDSTAPFHVESIISDVTRLVKGGKEANVYCCTAHPTMDVDLIAAKLYRPRQLRTLKNDAVYKAGRMLRGEEGKLLKGRREKLALAQKSRFGKHLDMVWWINNEFATQAKLYAAGADVPRPIKHSGNTILMDYIGDEHGPAPVLIDVSLEPAEAQRLFDRIMANVGLMLEHHLVHGDLSAYNILYWAGEATIIDFPQMVDARTNPHAFELLGRDIQRVCDYFGRAGVALDARQLTEDLWYPYMGRPA